MELLQFVFFILIVRAIYQLCTWTAEDHKNDLKYRAGVVKKGGGLLFKLFKGRM